MANKTTNLGAEVAQATASKINLTTSTTPDLNGNTQGNTRRPALPQYVVGAMQIHGGQLVELLNRFSATDYLSQLQTMDFDYYDLLHAIDAGGGLDRDPDEDPAEILQMLRTCYAPTPRRLAERANLLRCMGEILREVEDLVNALKNAQKEGFKV